MQIHVTQWGSRCDTVFSFPFHSRDSASTIVECLRNSNGPRELTSVMVVINPWPESDCSCNRRIMWHERQRYMTALKLFLPVRISVCVSEQWIWWLTFRRVVWVGLEVRDRAKLIQLKSLSVGIGLSAFREPEVVWRKGRRTEIENKMKHGVFIYLSSERVCI